MIIIYDLPKVNNHFTQNLVNNFYYYYNSKEKTFSNIAEHYCTN